MFALGYFSASSATRFIAAGNAAACASGGRTTSSTTASWRSFAISHAAVAASDRKSYLPDASGEPEKRTPLTPYAFAIAFNAAGVAGSVDDRTTTGFMRLG